ncbi:outer membrane protein assembly factor BamE domain-containing protein [Lysobacter sp. CA196]|uniref:outer membrane protein assembly factor BamE n=1 Tax=Lysobacter sp. CA196 TaxID=3455606 RepID=UPI003F8D005E
MKSALLHRLGLFTLAVSIAAVGTGCGTRHVSRDIAPDGTARDVVFPDRNRIVLKDGTFPNIDNLRTIGPGVTKDQLSALVGRPHFREGYAGVREWDYLFNFKMADGEIAQCQYKVIFDSGYKGRSFHWSPASCADILKPVADVDDLPTPSRSVTLSSDALFQFGRGDLAGMKEQGRAELMEMAGNLKGLRSVREIRIKGHTDRIGSDLANKTLSTLRASTVRRFLLDQGVGAPISAMGVGSDEPVKACSLRDRAELIGCLAPNRRVEVQVDGAK